MANRKLHAFILGSISVFGYAHAAEELEMSEILSVAKFTGACGILKSMSQFQNATKIEGGSEFIQRFWSTEAARLGKTPDQYVSECNQYIEAYERLWAITEETGR